jgi:hypothetical protein
VTVALDEMIDSLLYEGYALYPYTPGAVKNATPTPFGIAYPPAYASASGSTFDHLQMECLLEAGPRARVTGRVAFLQTTGERHEAVERRIGLPPHEVAGLVDREEVHTFSNEEVEGRLELAASLVEAGTWRVRLRVINTTTVENAGSLDRGAALRSSLLSTHPVCETSEGRFVSPLEAEGCVNTNTWPVLATKGEDAVVGAAIVLPDHPMLSPKSRGNLFDNTEIEEALLLHIHSLTDDEKAAIEQQDPAVKEMVQRALQTTPSDILDLHGAFAPSASAVSMAPPEVAGESRVEVDGVSFERGAKVILRPGERARAEDRKDAYDSLLQGKAATIERIYLDYEDRIYFGVTIDDDPGRELMRDSGRFLFFFVDEVELIER